MNLNPAHTAGVKLHWVLPLVLIVHGSRFGASAHPSSGLVVNDKGEVFFVHSGKGVAKIERNGSLTYVKRSTGGHWLCLDGEGSFARTQPKFFERITPDGEKPAIIFADGGAPLAVCRDGNLYYGSYRTREGDHQPSALTVSRMTPEGKLSWLTTNLAPALAALNEGVTGLAPGADGAFYISSPSSVFKVKMDGSMRTLASKVVPRGCDEDLPPNWRAPGFRGLAVATNGTVYAAATGCRCVVTIAPSGKMKTILKSERPWSPTDVALHAGEVYVLEWTNANGGPEDGWRPRVRKLAHDGTQTTLVEIKENVTLQRR